MKEYYELKLNCARVKPGMNRLRIKEETGFVKVGPKEGKKKVKDQSGMHYVAETFYVDPVYIIAEKKDDSFEDIILGEKIGYEPNGLSSYKNASLDELYEELNSNNVMTCFEYKKTTYDDVVKYMNMFKAHRNGGIYEQLENEFDYIKNKQGVKEEINDRLRHMEIEEKKRSDKTK